MRLPKTSQLLTLLLLSGAAQASRAPRPLQEGLRGDLEQVLQESAPGQLIPVTIVLREQVLIGELASLRGALPKPELRALAIDRLMRVAAGSQARREPARRPATRSTCSRTSPWFSHSTRCSSLSRTKIPSPRVSLAGSQSIGLSSDGETILISAPSPVGSSPGG